MVTGALSVTMKSRNERSAPDPIMMFGGSPIRVAVPPMFAAMTTGSRNATGFSRIARAICRAMGATKMTVVTLSAKAESTAVNQVSSVRMRKGLPCARFSIRATPHSKTPVLLSTPTTAIMDASRTRTFRSSAPWAPSNVMR